MSNLYFPSSTRAEDNSVDEIRKADLDLLDKINQVAAQGSGSSSSSSGSTTELTVGKVTYTKVTPDQSTSTIGIDWSKGEMFVLSPLTQSITLSFSNQRVTTIRIVVPHATTAVTYTVTFPVSYKIGTDGPSAYAYSLVGSTTQRYTTFDVYYDGSNLYVFEGKFHS